MVVLVTGAGGQLGQSLQHIAGQFSAIEWVFCDSSALDISSIESIEFVFSEKQPQYCINAAAYTAVDKAESESEKAHLINGLGPENLAKVCAKYNTTLLHISTDFVFDGTQSTPYVETDETHPLGVYGATKLEGELAIQKYIQAYYIIRTSWVYSPFGNNFMKTMLRLANEREQLSIVNDQIGTPTNALDLAQMLAELIGKDQLMQRPPYGVYHYSNEGQCSWFEFAQAIFEKNGVKIAVLPIPTAQFPTPAKRPAYSVMNKSKIKENFNVVIPDWRESLQKL
ncbi:MAG: dTDP-4-dehydrorhamnose reductase [Bacteroidota bacterium]|jgi:dTDP-4-dehydrorhamnose reductase